MNRQKIIVEIAIFLIGILALYFGIYQGSMLVLNSGKVLGDSQSSLARWENRQSIVQALNTQVANLSLKDQLTLAMPSSERTGDFLVNIQGAAQSAGVTISSFSPSANNSQAPAVAQNQTDTITPAQIVSYSINITTTGNYSQISTFLVNLEKIKRVTQIKQVDLEKVGDDSLTANLNVIVYYLNQ